MSSALRFEGLLVPDVIGTYRWPVHDAAARAVADTVHLGGWCDRLAFAELSTEPARIALHRTLYGNRARPRPRQRRQLELEL